MSHDPSWSSVWATQMANSEEPCRYNTEEAILKRGGRNEESLEISLSLTKKEKGRGQRKKLKESGTGRS